MGGSYGIAAANDCCRPMTRPQAIAEAGLRHWFAIQTRYRFEKTVVTQLIRKCVEVYLPLRVEHHRWSDRQQTVSIPLFPGYAFVQIDDSPHARQAVLKTSGLIGFVSFGGVVAAVPPKQISDLQLLLQQKALFSLQPFAQPGQRVRIRGGCLQGLEGVLSQDHRGKLLITIESIRQSVAIEIHGYELDLV